MGWRIIVGWWGIIMLVVFYQRSFGIWERLGEGNFRGPLVFPCFLVSLSDETKIMIILALKRRNYKYVTRDFSTHWQHKAA